jgi:hypothetical protein
MTTDTQRVVLVHLNIGVPTDDRRTPDEIGKAILDQLGLAHPWRPSVNQLEIEVVLADEVGPEITATGHVVGAVYRSSFWGGNYRVIRGDRDETVMEVIGLPDPPSDYRPTVGDHFSTNAQLSPLDERLESRAWVGRIDGTYGPLGFPSREAAEQYLAVCLVKLDPSGVEQGHYYIDGMIPGESD